MSIILRIEYMNDKYFAWAQYDDFSSIILEFDHEPTEQEVQAEVDKLKSLEV